MPIIFDVLLPLFKKYWAYILAALVIVALTLTAAWDMWKPAQAVPETPKPAAVQKDGSIILERAPDTKAKAPMTLPKGSTLERLAHITVQYKTPFKAIAGSVDTTETITEKPPNLEIAQNLKQDHIADPGKLIECPPVTLDLALVRMPDETRRVIASSHDGAILDALDIPVDDAKPSPVPNVWSIGVVANPFKQTLGGYVDRDFGWLRTGATLMQSEKGRFTDEFIVKMGINL